MKLRMVLIAVCAVVASRAAFGQPTAGEEVVLPWNERTVAALMVALNEKDRGVRSRAAWSLGELRREDAVEPLLRLLADPVPEVRMAAVNALGKIGAPSAADALRKSFEQEKSPAAKAAALEALLCVGARDVQGLFESALGVADEGLRLAAVRLLPRAEGLKATSLLLTCLDDESLRVRHQALVSLARVWSQAADDVAARNAVYGKAAPFLEDKEPMLRAAACDVLGAVGVDGAMPKLVARLKDEHYLVRRSAANALGETRVPAAVEVAIVAAPLVERLADSDHTVRQAAAQSLGRFTPPNAIVPLAARLEDETPEVRPAAAGALVKFAAKDALAAVAAILLKSRMVEARRQAAWVVAEWADPIAADAAVAALADEDVHVRAHSLRLLRVVGDRRCIPHALKVLQWENRDVREFDEMKEAYLVAAKFPEEPFVPLIRQRLVLAPKWEQLVALASGPPTSFQDMWWAIYAAGHFKRADFNAILEKSVSVPDLGEVAQQSLAIARNQPWSPPEEEPAVRAQRRATFFVTCYESNELK